MAYENVRSTGIVTVEENNEWRFGNHTDDGTVSVTLDLSTFNVKDETKRDKYLTGLGDKATTIWIKSGIPLAKITASGAYGPYDPNATDGRQNKIAGLLESMVEISVTFGGWDVVNGANVGMRYRGDIIKSKLPVVPADGAVWGGSFFDIEDDTVTPLSNASATSGPSTPTTITAANITDASAVGRSILTASDAAAARTAIGRGHQLLRRLLQQPEGQADDSPRLYAASRHGERARRCQAGDSRAERHRGGHRDRAQDRRRRQVTNPTTLISPPIVAGFRIPERNPQ